MQGVYLWEIYVEYVTITLNPNYIPCSYDDINIQSLLQPAQATDQKLHKVWAIVNNKEREFLLNMLLIIIFNAQFQWDGKNVKYKSYKYWKTHFRYFYLRQICWLAHSW